MIIWVYNNDNWIVSRKNRNGYVGEWLDGPQRWEDMMNILVNYCIYCIIQ